MKILVAIDGSTYSQAAVVRVAERPWPPGSEVCAITVDPPLPADVLRSGSPTMFDELIQQQRNEAHRHLSEAVATIKQLAPDLPVTPFLCEGYPKEDILDEADRWGADLIVLGSHGYGAIRRLFLGSVSLAVATGANCSIEIVRTPAR